MSTPIRTPDQRLRVFVSSTLGELAEERKAVARAIEALRLIPVMFEMGARPHPPQDLYRAYLAQSDIFIGLYWQRYGWVGPGMDISGLEDEFRLSEDMPRLLYVKAPAPDREPGLTAMIESLQTGGTEAYRTFRTNRELSQLVRDDLAVLLSERFAASAAPVSLTTAQVTAEPEDSPSRPARSLPVATTSLIGRDRDIEQAAHMVQTPDARLVTLTGPGGIGKTRLAVAVAERLKDRYPSGAVFVPLASLDDAGLVMHRVAAAVGASIGGTQSALDAVADHLGDTPTLLVLDNLEQVVAAAPQIDELLARCPGVTILATSRTVLRLRAEREYPVAPLAVPASTALALDEVAAQPAVALFVDRARAVRPDFDLTEGNATAVGEISRRLDGLPLAIELAAARTRLLDPAALLARLGTSFDSLGAGPVDLPERQRTLRATVEWSVGLLDDAERAMLAAVSVFVDGWTIGAAVAVGGFGEDRTLDLLDALVGHSLVQVVEAESGGTRFRMLGAVREYAAELLAASPQHAEVQQRHAAFYRKFAENADWLLESIGPADSAQRLATEEGNLRAAVHWCLAHDVTALPPLFRVMWMFWWLGDHMVEGRQWVHEMLPQADRLDDQGRAELALMHGVVSVESGDDTGSLAAGEELTRLEGRSGDSYIEAVALLVRSWILPIVDDYDGALRAAAGGLDGLRSHDEPFMTAGALNTLGMLEAAVGHHDAARRHLTESIELGHRTGQTWNSVIGEVQLATLAAAEGQVEESRRLLHDALEATPESELPTHAVTFALVTVARLAMAEAEPKRAAEALGAADGLRRRAGLRVWTTARTTEDDFRRQVEAALAPAAFAEALERGARMNRRDAIALLREQTGPRQPHS